MFRSSIAFTDLTVNSACDELFPGVEDVDAQATHQLRAALDAFEEGVYEFHNRAALAAAAGPQPDAGAAQGYGQRRNRRQQAYANRIPEDRQFFRPVEVQSAEWAAFKPHLWLRGRQVHSSDHGSAAPHGPSAAWQVAPVPGSLAAGGGGGTMASAGPHAKAPVPAAETTAAAVTAGSPTIPSRAADAAGAAAEGGSESAPDLAVVGSKIQLGAPPPGFQVKEEVMDAHGRDEEIFVVQYDDWEAHVPPALRKRRGRTRDEKAVAIGLPPVEPQNAVLYDITETLLPQVWTKLGPLLAPVLTRLAARRQERQAASRTASLAFRGRGCSARTGGAAGDLFGLGGGGGGGGGEFEIITFSSDGEEEVESRDGLMGGSDGHALGLGLGMGMGSGDGWPGGDGGGYGDSGSEGAGGPTGGPLSLPLPYGERSYGSYDSRDGDAYDDADAFEMAALGGAMPRGREAPQQAPAWLGPEGRDLAGAAAAAPASSSSSPYDDGTAVSGATVVPGVGPCRTPPPGPPPVLPRDFNQQFQQQHHHQQQQEQQRRHFQQQHQQQSFADQPTATPGAFPPLHRATPVVSPGAGGLVAPPPSLSGSHHQHTFPPLSATVSYSGEGASSSPRSSAAGQQLAPLVPLAALAPTAVGLGSARGSHHQVAGHPNVTHMAHGSAPWPGQHPRAHMPQSGGLGPSGLQGSGLAGLSLVPVPQPAAAGTGTHSPSRRMPSLNRPGPSGAPATGAVEPGVQQLPGGGGGGGGNGAGSLGAVGAACLQSSSSFTSVGSGAVEVNGAGRDGGGGGFGSLGGVGTRGSRGGSWPQGSFAPHGPLFACQPPSKPPPQFPHFQAQLAAPSPVAALSQYSRFLAGATGPGGGGGGGGTGLGAGGYCGGGGGPLSACNSAASLPAYTPSGGIATAAAASAGAGGTSRGLVAVAAGGGRTSFKGRLAAVGHNAVQLMPLPVTATVGVGAGAAGGGSNPRAPAAAAATASPSAVKSYAAAVAAGTQEGSASPVAGSPQRWNPPALSPQKQPPQQQPPQQLRAHQQPQRPQQGQAPRRQQRPRRQAAPALHQSPQQSRQYSRTASRLSPQLHEQQPVSNQAPHQLSQQAAPHQQLPSHAPGTQPPDLQCSVSRGPHAGGGLAASNLTSLTAEPSAGSIGGGGGGSGGRGGGGGRKSAAASGRGLGRQKSFGGGGGGGGGVGAGRRPSKRASGHSALLSPPPAMLPGRGGGGSGGGGGSIGVRVNGGSGAVAAAPGSGGAPRLPVLAAAASRSFTAGSGAAVWPAITGRPSA